VSDLVRQLESQFKTPLLPLEVVRTNFFPHLSADTFNRRARANDLGFPVITAERSQKSAMFVHINDLGAYLESRREVAAREHAMLASA
jgi:hypothetical protein